MEFSSKHTPSAAEDCRFALIATTAATATGMALRGVLDPANLVMLYLLATVMVASRLGRRASIITAILSALSFDFFLVKPYYSLAISDLQYVIAFMGLLVTGLVIGDQTSKLQTERNFFRTKEHNTSVLYAMSNELTARQGRDLMVTTIAHHLAEAFYCTVTVWFPETPLPELREEQAARWAYDHHQPAGLGTATLPGANSYYVPLSGTESVIGVLALTPRNAHIFAADEREMIHTFANLAASALERADTAAIAEKAQVEAEGEKLRNALLSAVSHDFRTPLASIKGVISSLLMEDSRITAEDRKDLLNSAHGEVARLERIVANLLEVTLLESGKLKLKKDYYFLSELTGNALKQTESVLQGREITCHLPQDLPALHVDGLLIEQVLVNLLENVAKYTPQGSPLTLFSGVFGGQMTIMIEDTGPGIPAGDEEKIFEAFHTSAVSGRKGSGLGLAICRGILQAHGGSIKADNRPEGAVFTITLPLGVIPDMTEAA